MNHAHAGGIEQHFHDDVITCAHPCRAEVEFAGLRLGGCNQTGDVIGGEIGPGDQHVAKSNGHGDGYKAFEAVVGQLGI